MGNGFMYMTYYDGGFYELFISGQVVSHYHIDGAGGNEAVYIERTRTTPMSYCIEADHLGSVTGLYDSNGNKCFNASYDVWGRRTVSYGSIDYIWGFTGHEDLDFMGLIDMNGRMYDPRIGRFLSPDNYIQSPSDPQNYNRYSYCLNNPLKYTDPSGEIVWEAVLFGAIIGANLNVAFQGASGNINTVGDVFKFATVGALSGAAGPLAGQLVASSISFGGFLGGFVIGGSSGFASGFISGSGNAWLNDSNFDDGLKAGVREGLIGGLTAGLLGGVSSGIGAKLDGRRFWDGASVSFNELYEQNMPIVGQNGKENCLPATAESIEKHFGGDMTQDDFRALIGGDPETDGIMDTEFWNKVRDNYDIFGSFKINKKSFIKMERNLRRNYGIAITLGGDINEGHSVVVSGIYQKQIINVKGCSHLSKYNWYRIMDPAKGGSYRLVNRYYLSGYNSFYLYR